MTFHYSSGWFAHRSSLLILAVSLVGPSTGIGQQGQKGILRAGQQPDFRFPDSTHTVVIRNLESVFKKKEEDGAFHYQSQTGDSTLIARMGNQTREVDEFEPEGETYAEYWLKMIPHGDTVFLKCVSVRDTGGKEEDEGRAPPEKFEGIYEMIFKEGDIDALKDGGRAVLQMKPGEHDRFLAETEARFREPANLARIEERAKKEFLSSFNKALTERPEVFLPRGLDPSRIEAFRERVAGVKIDAEVSLSATPSVLTVDGDTLTWSTGKQEMKSLLRFSLPAQRR